MKIMKISAETEKYIYKNLLAEMERMAWKGIKTDEGT